MLTYLEAIHEEVDFSTNNTMYITAIGLTRTWYIFLLELWFSRTESPHFL